MNLSLPPNPPPSSPKPRRSRLAVASLVLSGGAVCILSSPFFFRPNDCVWILFLLCFFGSPILGIASLIVIYRSHSRLTGKGMAIVSLCLWVLVIVAPAIPGPRSLPQSNRMACAQNLKQIYLALNAYYEDNHCYPPSFGSLFPKYLSTPTLQLFHCPAAKVPPMKGKFDEQLCSYRCIAYPENSFQESDEDGLILALDKSFNNHGDGLSVVYLDGHGVFTSLETLASQLGAMANSTKLSPATRDSARKVLTEIMAERQP
jgi:hypothetical protein